MDAPIDEIAACISSMLYSEFSFTDPSVNLGMYDVPCKDLAISVGEMQRATIGFLFSTQYVIKSLTSCKTHPSVPAMAQLLKFLSAPNPPGITKEEISSLFNSESERISPLAILADSTNTFLVSFISSPFV